MPEAMYDEFLEHYSTLVKNLHPDQFAFWPVLSGYNLRRAEFRSWVILFYEHTANPVMRSRSSVGVIAPSVTGYDDITDDNKSAVRANLERFFNAKNTDAVLLIHPQVEYNNEIQLMLERHEFAMGLVSMKVFLSHKGGDKPLVREFKNILHQLGFDPWLDEDAMHAGVELERSILKGFKDSCAAVFFVTSNFIDENFLATEINYAIAEKREKRDRFAIITIVLDSGATVPELLRPYVWKEPASNLDALREILRALPVQVGRVYWK